MKHTAILLIAAAWTTTAAIAENCPSACSATKAKQVASKEAAKACDATAKAACDKPCDGATMADKKAGEATDKAASSVKETKKVVKDKTVAAR
jgi:hypothetical protein